MIINLDPGDIATWIGSIGTLGAFIAAFLQIRTERKHRRRFEFHTWLARRREHADRVTAWTAGARLLISNDSRHLVHDVEVVLDSGRRINLDHAEPGRTTHELEGDVGTLPVVSLTFTDAHGNRWVRQGTHAPDLIAGPDARVAEDQRARFGPNQGGV